MLVFLQAYANAILFFTRDLVWLKLSFKICQKDGARLSV